MYDTALVQGLRRGLQRGLKDILKKQEEYLDLGIEAGINLTLDEVAKQLSALGWPPEKVPEFVNGVGQKVRQQFAEIEEKTEGAKELVEKIWSRDDPVTDEDKMAIQPIP